MIGFAPAVEEGPRKEANFLVALTQILRWLDHLLVSELSQQAEMMPQR